MIFWIPAAISHQVLHFERQLHYHPSQGQIPIPQQWGQLHHHSHPHATSFWRQFLAGVFDGALELRTAAHASFVQNKLDRDAVGVISMDGSAMYEADLAQTPHGAFQ